MSASEIIKELPKLSEAERRAVLDKLRELAVRDEDVRMCEQTADEQAAQLDRLEEAAADYRAVDLRSRGITEAQARDLRARLKTFAEDWERPKLRSTIKTRRGISADNHLHGGVNFALTWHISKERLFW